MWIRSCFQFSKYSRSICSSQVKLLSAIMIFEKLFRLFHWDNIVTRSVADFSVRALSPASQPMNLCNVNSKATSALGGEGRKPPTKHGAADAAATVDYRCSAPTRVFPFLTHPARANEGSHCDNPGGIKLPFQWSVTSTISLLQKEHPAPLRNVFATASIPLRLRHWRGAHQTSQLEKCENRRVTNKVFPPASLSNTGNKNKGWNQPLHVKTKRD